MYKKHLFIFLLCLFMIKTRRFFLQWFVWKSKVREKKKQKTKRPTRGKAALASSPSEPHVTHFESDCWVSSPRTNPAGFAVKLYLGERVRFPFPSEFAWFSPLTPHRTIIRDERQLRPRVGQTYSFHRLAWKSWWNSKLKGVSIHVRYAGLAQFEQALRSRTQLGSATAGQADNWGFIPTVYQSIY